MRKNVILSKFLSTVLLTTSLFSSSIQCTGSHCRIDLSNLHPTRNMIKHVAVFSANKPIIEEVKVIKTPAVENQANNSELIALEPSKYLMGHEDTVELEGEKNTIILAHSKYVATGDEVLEYEEEDSLIASPVEKVEDKILNKSLPTSLHYCADETQAVYHEESDSYECA